MAKIEVTLKGGLQAQAENVVTAGPVEIWKCLLLTPASEGCSIFIGWGEDARDAIIDALQRREYSYEELNQ